LKFFNDALANLTPFSSNSIPFNGKQDTLNGQALANFYAFFLPKDVALISTFEIKELERLWVL
jgi:hypothetical protein